MKRTLLIGSLIVILIAGLFVLTGCGDNKQSNSNTAVDTSNALVQATEFYIQNSFPNDTTIKEIYATVSGLETWSPNLISGLELAPGTRSKIGLGLTSNTTNWDLKLVDQEGTSITLSVDFTKVLEKTADTVELTVADGEITAIVK